ncbi:MAG: methyltransferase [Rhodobacteraceae bacterium]|nr:methyltransferase [Paracoccaceae bacterium]
MKTTHDGFLGGRLVLEQPATGYRAATEPVFLAAACPATTGDNVLDLGCGVGVAALCLAQRVPGVTVTGVEVQPAYAELARLNAAANGLSLEVAVADIARLPPGLAAQNFDHVILNPPFFEGGRVICPHDTGCATARVETLSLIDWCDFALRRLKPKGTITIIQRVERFGDIVAGLGDRAGGIRILPIAARGGRSAGRVLVQAKKTSRTPLVLLPPFHVHDGPVHVTDGDDFSAAARAILRDGSALPLG